MCITYIRWLVRTRQREMQSLLEGYTPPKLDKLHTTRCRLNRVRLEYYTDQVQSLWLLTPLIVLMIGSFNDLNSQYPPTIKNRVEDSQMTLNRSSPSKSPITLFDTWSTYSANRSDIVTRVFIFLQGSSTSGSLPTFSFMVLLDRADIFSQKILQIIIIIIMLILLLLDN